MAAANRTPGDTLEALRQVALFSALDEEALTSIAQVTTQREVPRGEILFFEHDPGDALYMIRTGAIKIYRVGEDGREKTLTLLEPGSAFGEMALLDDEPRSAVAQALESSRLLVLSRDDFRRVLSERPAMAQAVIRELSRRLRRTNAQLMDLVFRDVRTRVGKVLLELADRYGEPHDNGVRIELKLTHQELANLVGTSRESVTRVLAELQDERIIGFDGRTLLLLDSQRLESDAE